MLSTLAIIAFTNNPLLTRLIFLLSLNGIENSSGAKSFLKEVMGLVAHKSGLRCYVGGSFGFCLEFACPFCLTVADLMCFGTFSSFL